MSKKLSKAVFSCGGTGGHLFPAVALAQEMEDRQLGVDTLFIVSDKQLEKDCLAHYNQKFAPVVSARIRNFKSIANIPHFFSSVKNCFSVLCKHGPEVVFGFGGFTSCFPILLGFLMGKKCYLHEQNIVPGKVTRLMSFFARRIFVTFPQSIEHLPAICRKKAVVSGNPVRREVGVKMPVAKARKSLGLSPDVFTVLVLGGSQGARCLNDRIPEILGSCGFAIQVVHLAGKGAAQEVASRYAKAGISARCFDFSQEMNVLYSAADMVIMRSGATALTEVMFHGLLSVLVPFPYAAHDHQKLNALHFARQGVAFCVEEKDLTCARITECIKRIKEIKEQGGSTELFSKVNVYGSKTTLCDEFLKAFEDDVK